MNRIFIEAASIQQIYKVVIIGIDVVTAKLKHIYTHTHPYCINLNYNPHFILNGGCFFFFERHEWDRYWAETKERVKCFHFVSYDIPKKNEFKKIRRRWRTEGRTQYANIFETHIFGNKNKRDIYTRGMDHQPQKYMDIFNQRAWPFWIFQYFFSNPIYSRKKYVLFFLIENVT